MVRVRNIAAVALIAVTWIAAGSAQDDGVLTRSQSERVASIKTKTPGEFYVALESVSDATAWRPKTVQECVDRGFIAGIRRWFGRDDAVTASVIVKTKGFAGGDVTIPLFVVTRNEKGTPDGKPLCSSSVFNSLVTPYIKADAQATFSFEVTPMVAKDASVATATRLANLASQLTAVGGGAGAILSKLSSNPVQALTQSIDQELSISWGGSGQSADSITTDLTVFPPDDDWKNQVDVITLNLPKLIATRGGVNATQAMLPSAKLRIQFRDSLIAAGGRYPESASGILGSSLTKTKADTLLKLIKEGLPNATEVNLVQANNASQMASICRALKDVFGPSLTSRDALVALYAVLERFSSYSSNSAIRTDVCLNGNEQKALKAINAGFAFSPDTREGADQRGQQVSDIYVPIAKALANGSSQAIQGVSAENGQTLRLAVSDADQLPARTDGKPWAASGPEAISRLQELRQQGGFMRLGCFQARLSNSLSMVAGVLAVSTKTLGVAIETDSAGKLKAMRLGSIDTIRDLVLSADSGTWPMTSCDLVG